MGHLGPATLAGERARPPAFFILALQSTLLQSTSMDLSICNAAPAGVKSGATFLFD
jgi:hypothetical protein